MFDRIRNELKKILSPKIGGSKLSYGNVPQSDNDCVDGMFPRVYKQQQFNDIELTLLSRGLLELNSEYLRSIVDKFVRVTNVAVTESERFNRRYDRDEIRKRLAMGFRADTVNTNCHRSMQNGKILPLILMNDISSDNESHSSDSETCPKLSKVAQKKNSGFSNIFTAESPPVHPYICRPLSVSYLDTKINELSNEDRECDFFAKQARLQIEARMALAQAKDMAHIQMEIDRQKQLSSPITDVIRGSLGKVGIQMSSEKRRVSRQMLTDMNIAQLQIIVNDLHTHIENLNESLVHYLMERDELHMGQDAMLIDIEDLTRYLGAKEQSLEQKRNLSIFKRQQ